MKVKHDRRAHVWALLAALLFIVVSWLVIEDKLSSFDSGVIGVVQGWESPSVTRIAETLSAIGSTIGVIVIVAVVGILLAAMLGHRKELVLFGFSVGGAALLNTVLKSTFQRERPHVKSRKGRLILIVSAVLLVISIGLSRIYLGVHYPSDVLAGYLASMVWLGLGIELFRGWLRSSSKS